MELVFAYGRFDYNPNIMAPHNPHHPSGKIHKRNDQHNGPGSVGYPCDDYARPCQPGLFCAYKPGYDIKFCENRGG